MTLRLHYIRLMMTKSQRNLLPLLLLSRRDTKVAHFVFWIWKTLQYQRSLPIKKLLVLLLWKMSLRSFFRCLRFRLSLIFVSPFCGIVFIVDPPPPPPPSNPETGVCTTHFYSLCTSISFLENLSKPLCVLLSHFAFLWQEEILDETDEYVNIHNRYCLSSSAIYAP